MYDEMYKYVKEVLVDNENNATKISYFPFRKVSEHTRRVIMWTKRLIEDKDNINKEAILVAAIFHDIGYATSRSSIKHAENSAILCEKYLKENNFSDDFIEFVAYLVKNHSNKELMTVKETPLELIILMEADLLDETGALSIVWDCMMEGSQKEQSYENTYDHVLNYSSMPLDTNPMVTTKARLIWERKQKLIKDFIEELSGDLGIEEDSEIK